MLIWVAMQEIEQFVHRLIACYSQSPQQFRLGSTVNGEHINIDAADIVAVFTFYQRRTTINDLAKTTGIVWVCLDAQCLQRLRKPFAGMFHKVVVVRTRHTDVHVIIPGNKTLMPYRTQHGSCPTVIADMMLAAHLVNLQQNLQDMFV